MSGVNPSTPTKDSTDNSVKSSDSSKSNNSVKSKNDAKNDSSYNGKKEKTGKANKSPGSNNSSGNKNLESTATIIKSTGDFGGKILDTINQKQKLEHDKQISKDNIVIEEKRLQAATVTANASVTVAETNKETKKMELTHDADEREKDRKAAADKNKSDGEHNKAVLASKIQKHTDKHTLEVEKHRDAKAEKDPFLKEMLKRGLFPMPVYAAPTSASSSHASQDSPENSPRNKP